MDLRSNFHFLLLDYDRKRESNGDSLVDLLLKSKVGFLVLWISFVSFMPHKQNGEQSLVFIE